MGQSLADKARALLDGGTSPGRSMADLAYSPVASGTSVDPPHGGIYFTDDATTTITAAGTYVKAAGVTAYSSPMRSEVDDGGGVNNRLRYTGAVARHFHVVAQASINFVSGTNQVASLQVWKYDASEAVGELVAHSKATAIVAGQGVAQITSHADFMLENGDYIELHVANIDGTGNIVVQEGYVFAMGMIPQISLA